jgi:hypothetical protein
VGADQVGNGADIFANCRRGAPSADSIQAAPQVPVLDLFVSNFLLISLAKSTKRKYANNRYLEPE